MLVIMKRIRFLATNEEAQTLTYFPRTTRLMAVVGTPLAHSLSPQIHNKTIDRLGLPYCYVPIEINLTNDDAVMAFLQWSWQIGIEGMNVTLPYKERFAKVLNARLPSINTLTRGESFWECHSTDGIGFLRAAEKLSSQAIADYKELLILGNGGAALAVADTWKKTYPELSITVFRRANNKDPLWEKILGTDRLSFFPFDPQILGSQISKASARQPVLVVQASSAPLHGDDLSEFIPAFSSFNGSFLDMTYGEKTSAILKDLMLRGCPANDGLPMLVEQALASQMLWWGQSDTYDQVYKDLKSTLG